MGETIEHQVPVSRPNGVVIHQRNTTEPPPHFILFNLPPYNDTCIDELNVKKMAKILLFFLPRISCYQIILIVYRCYCFPPPIVLIVRLYFRLHSI